MDYLSSFSDCAGAVSGFPTAEAPAAFPETGAYSHEKEDTQEKWFFYDPLAWTAWLSTLLENKPPGTEYRTLPTVPTQGKPVIHRAKLWFMKASREVEQGRDS